MNGLVASAPRAAATVVLLREGANGLEVLLTKRPSTMAFAPNAFVFPGGALDPDDGDPSSLDAFRAAAVRELAEEAAVTVAADSLVPLSRWVTPPVMPRRFDAWFFAAALPRDAAAHFDPAEVVEHRWLRPADALDPMADGDVELWVPTATTLRQLAWADTFADVRSRLAADSTPVAQPRAEVVAPDVIRVVLTSAGAVPGQTVSAYVVGRQRMVVVDPGDPSEEAFDALVGVAQRRGAEIVAIVLTHGAPDHAAGAEGMALRLEIPILGGPGAGRWLPHDVVELENGAPLDVDVHARVVYTSGPAPEHIAIEVGQSVVLVGDLVGDAPSRSILPPPDAGALRRSLTDVTAPGPRLLLPGHGEPPSA